MSSKQAYQQKLRAQLDEWQAKIQAMEAKASKANADAKIEYEQHIQDLKAKRDAAKAKLDELGDASDDAWEDMKRGVEDAWGRLGQAIRSASARFK